MRAWASAWILGLGFISMFAGPAMAFVPRSGSTVIVSQAIPDDLYLAGGTVMTSAPVDGDIVAAGGNVDLAGGASGGVLATGGTLTLGGTIGRSLRAAGGTVTLDAQISGDAVVAGGVVRVQPAARVGRDLVVGGGTLNVAGMVGRNALISGGDVVIGGAIRGDADIQANRIILLPTARIGGALRYSADRPIEVQAGAQVAGGTTQVQRPLRPRRMMASPLGARFRLWRGVAEMIAFLVLGFVTFALAPRGASVVVREIHERFWRSLLIGFVLLVTVPAAALLLLFTVVAIPLSAIAMLLYFATLYPGQLFVAAWLGQAILTRIGREKPPSAYWSLVVGALVLVIAFAFPFAGWVIRLVAVCSGFGALWVILWAGVTLRPVASGT
jgi:cytoskeletal protein CcmA (bactofilin family)